jgi:hypothetical protein
MSDVIAHHFQALCPMDSPEFPYVFDLTNEMKYVCEELRLLLNPEDLNPEDRSLLFDQFTMLQQVSMGRNVVPLEMLLRSATQKNKEVALSCAAAFGQGEAVGMLLIGASDAAKSFALYSAAQGRQLRVVKALMSAGVRCPKDAVDRIRFGREDLDQKIKDLLTRPFLP